MKPRYALVELASNAPTSDASIAAQQAELKTHKSEDTPALTLDSAAALLPLSELSTCVFVVLFGNCSKEEIVARCQEAKKADLWPIVIVDALDIGVDATETLSNLEIDLVQMHTTNGIISCITSGRSFVYSYAKTDCTATVCLLFDGGIEALVIERLHDPHKDKIAFPGGFMRIFMEKVEDCAYRELQEECGLKMLPGELVLVDIRSRPDRDPRAHIIDVGYAALVSNRRKPELLAQLKAGDDAGKAHLLPVAELLSSDLAFDHHEFLLNTLRHFNIVRMTS